MAPIPSVDVVIRGRSYLLKASDNSDYVRELARMLDERMAAVESGTKTVDTQRIAVLAALNLADDYCRLKEEYQARIEELEQERDRLLTLVEGALQEGT